MIKVGLDVHGMTFMDDYWLKACRGVIQYAREHADWQILINDSNLSLAHSFLSFEDLLRLGAQGIIFFTRDREINDRVAQLRLPAVNMMGSMGDSRFPSVRQDDLEIGAMAARHLIDRGFRNLGFCGPSNWNWSDLRAKAFAEVAHKACCECFFHMPRYRKDYVSMVAPQLPRKWTTADALRRWVSGLPKPVGIMGCHDQRAIHVLEACHDLGLKVPGEVAVIGADNNLMVCESRLPSLSSVDLNAEKIGYEAAAMMEQLLAGVALRHKHVIVPPRGIVTRMSSDVLAVESRDVAAALRYVGDHFSESISVGDIARAAGVSRGYLSRSFRKHLRCSIGEELRRRRLQHAQTLLLDRTLTLQEIASSAGFVDAPHLCRLFAELTGMTPGAWRNKHAR